MANTYKNTKTLNPALRSIGNMNVRGVVKGGTSDIDKAERYGLPVMVSETGYIDPSLLQGGGGGGTTEERVKELINENLQPYNNGEEIKADVDTKITSATAEVMISNKLQPYTDGQAIKNEVDTKQTAAQVETAIAEKFQPYNDGEEIKADIDGKVSKLELPEAIKEQIQQSTEIHEEITNIVEEVLNPYESGQQIKDAIDEKLTQEQTEAVIADKLQPYNSGSEIEADINTKVATTNYDADFAVFDSEQGATKGEKIKSYIDNITPPAPEDVIEKTDMAPYGQTDKSQTGTEIETAIAEKVDYVEFETFESEVGDNIGEKIRSAITGGTSGITESKLSECLSPYSTSSADITEIGTKIKADTDAKVATDDFESEFATFDTETGATQGERIKAYIDAHSGDPTAILQADMSPYGQTDKSQTGAEIQTALNAKANTSEVVAITDYAADFNNFDAETGDTKGEKIQNYIDDLTDAKVDVTAMAPFEDDPTKIGVSIQNAIISASKTDDEIKMLAEAKIAEDCEVGGTIDDAINAKLTNNLTTSDLSPYGQTDKAQTGADIQTALNLKADAADLSGKVDTTTYDADFSNFGESGHTKGEDIANYVNAQGALKVDITAMAPYADEPSKIGEAIQAAIDAGGGGISTETFQQYMSPYGATSASTTGTEIKSGLDAKLSTATFDTEFEAFGQGADTKGELIKNYVDSQMNSKLNISAMDPFIGDESDVGQNIAAAIDEKLDADTLKTYMEPYGQQDITQLGNEIKEAISAATKTDEQIKALAEAQIVTDIADGGTIDTAIDDKLTAENVLRQSDLAPFGEDEITEVGADIQIAINAVDAKTKTDQQIKDLADGQITLNAVEPTDMGEFYTDDKTQIGANIKAAILAGGDPDNPSVKQSDLAPYGVSDITQAGAEIHNEITTAISTAFAPFENGEAIVADQQLQNSSFDNKLQKVSDSILPTIKNAFDVNNYKFSSLVSAIEKTGNDYGINQNNSYYSSVTGLEYYVKGNLNEGETALESFSLMSYNYETKETTEVFKWEGLTFSGNSSLDVVFISCEDDPSIVLLKIKNNWEGQNYFALTKDNGQTWNRYDTTIQITDNITYPSNIFKDKNNNYFFFGNLSNYVYVFKLNLSDFSRPLYDVNADRKIMYTVINNYNGIVITLKHSDGNEYLWMIKSSNYAYLKDWESFSIVAPYTPYKPVKTIVKSDYGQDYPSGVGTYIPWKIGTNLVAFYIYYYSGSSYKTAFLGICDNFETNLNWDNEPLVFKPVKARNNTLHGKTYNEYPLVQWTGSSGDVNGGQLTTSGIFLAVMNNLVFCDYTLDTSAAPRARAILDLDKKEVYDVSVDIPQGVFADNYYYYSLNGFYLAKNSFPFARSVYYGYNSAPSSIFMVDDNSIELDSFKVGDILVTCRNPGASWLECDGSTFTEESYPLLAKIITDLTLPTATPSWITGGTTTFKAYIKAK